MSDSSPQIVETPSGKDAAYENFPVGSWLLPAALRPHIAAYYRFARAIDDVADSAELSSEEKISRLTGFEDAIHGRNAADDAYVTGHRMRASLDETDTSPQHCLDLITAFKQDAVKLRYDDWDDLVAYCMLSAAPVGRYLVDLHGGSDDGYGPSDALCVALQVINHLQDCQDDFRTLNRVYLPGDWMAEEGSSIDDIDGVKLTLQLRRVIDRCLDATTLLMDNARALPGGLPSRRLAMESQAIINISDRLIIRLRQNDPLAMRVALSKPAYLWSCLLGVAQAVMSGRRT